MRNKIKSSFTLLLCVGILSILACNISTLEEEEPTIQVLAPLQGSTFGVHDTIIVHFLAEADSTIARVEMTLDGVVIAAQEGGPSPYEGVFSWSAPQAGSYNLILTAFNSADSVSPPAGVSIIVEGAVEEKNVPVEQDVPDESDDSEIEQAEPTEQVAQQSVVPSEIMQPLAPFYLTDGGYFDFDHTSGIHGGAVFFEQPDPALPEINFWNDRIMIYELGFIALWGDTQPTFDDCRSAALSGSEIPTQNLPVGTTVCFQTDRGNFGFFTVQDRYLDQYGDLVMGFDYVLWDAAGIETPVDQALQTISGATYPQGIKGKDLDYYRNIRVVDLTFEAVSDTLIHVIPAAGAQLAVWGPEIPTYQDCTDLALGSQPVPVELEQSPEVTPVREALFYCYRTDEGRLGRLFIKSVYLGWLSAPSPYGDPWASADFRIVYEGEGILVEYYADTWALPDEPPTGLIPQRAAAAALSGRLVMPFATKVDFDLGTTLVDPRSISEFELLANESTGLAQLVPWYETILQAPWGETTPGYADCQAANLTNDAIPLQNGQFVCFQTSTGRIGYYLVNGFYFDAEVYLYNSAEFYADLSYTLWMMDGQMMAVHEPVHVLGAAQEWLQSGSYDLDMELGAFTEDLTFEVIGADQVQFAPAPGVGLAYWGLTLPTSQDCSTLSLTSETKTVVVSDTQNYDIPGFQKLNIPAFFCYQTDEGRWGRLEFEGIYENQDNGQIHLMIMAETWHSDGDSFGTVMSGSESVVGEPVEDSASEMVPDEQGVIKSGQIRLPNVSAYDFVSEVIDQKAFSYGDLILENNPDNLEGCFVSLYEPGGTMLGPYPDDLTSIDVGQLGGFTTGCLPMEIDGVYILIRGTKPGDYVVFRVTAFDAEGVTLEYIVGVYP
jgi:hypothetical protein